MQAVSPGPGDAEVSQKSVMAPVGLVGGLSTHPVSSERPPMSYQPSPFADVAWVTSRAKRPGADKSGVESFARLMGVLFAFRVGNQ